MRALSGDDGVCCFFFFSSRRRHTRSDRDWSSDVCSSDLHDVLQSVDPYALVVTAGDNDTFPLWYAQEVDGVRKDVSVLVLSLANTGWYLRQLQRRAPPTFDAGSAPDLYRGHAWPRPAPPWMSRFYLGSPPDTLPEYVPLAQPATGYLRPIAVKLDPGALGRPDLMLSDLAV